MPLFAVFIQADGLRFFRTMSTGVGTNVFLSESFHHFLERECFFDAEEDRRWPDENLRLTTRLDDPGFVDGGDSRFPSRGCGGIIQPGA